MASSTGIRTAPLIPTGTWQVDAAHSSVSFSVKHMGIANVRGKFGEFPETRFESTDVEVIDDESSRVVGNLTMHGITRAI